MLVDTSSAAAARTLDVGPEAAELAELIAEPIVESSVAAVVTYSGVAITNDIRASPASRDVARQPDGEPCIQRIVTLPQAPPQAFSQDSPANYQPRRKALLNHYGRPLSSLAAGDSQHGPRGRR